MYIDFDENGRMNNVSVKYFKNSIKVKDRIIYAGNVFYMIDNKLVFFKNYNLRREDLKKEIKELKNTVEEFKKNNSTSSDEKQQIEDYLNFLDGVIDYYNDLSVNLQERFSIIIYTDSKKEYVNDGTSHLFYIYKPLFITHYLIK